MIYSHVSTHLEKSVLCKIACCARGGHRHYLCPPPTAPHYTDSGRVRVDKTCTSILTASAHSLAGGTTIR